MDASLERLVPQFAFDGRLLHAWELSGGISAHMTALEMVDAQGQARRVVVRQPGATGGDEAEFSSPATAPFDCGGANPAPPPLRVPDEGWAAEDEFRNLRLAHALGLPAPEPLYLDAVGETMGRPCLVMSYIDGTVEFAPADPAVAARQMAVLLARLHRSDLSSIDPALLPLVSRGWLAELERPTLAIDPAFQVECIRETLAAASSTTSDTPGEDRAAAPSSGTLSGGARRSLRAPQSKGAVAGLALLHGDFWPGNLLWRDGQIAGLVDWEDACLGDPLQDFAIARLDLLWIYGRAAFEAFTHVYREQVQVDMHWLAYWDLYAVLRLARLAGSDLDGWAGFFRPYGREDITPQGILEAVGWFVEHAYRVV